MTQLNRTFRYMAENDIQLLIDAKSIVSDSHNCI